MHRIDEVGHDSNLFTEGDPANYKFPTRFGATWPNAVQEEISRPIEYSGATLNTGAETAPYNQLLDAIGQSWVTFKIDSGPTLTELDSRNLAASGGLARTSAGVYVVKWEIAYANANYLCLVSVADSTASIWATIVPVDADEVTVRVFNAAGAYETVTGNLRINVRCSGTVAT